MKNGISSIAPLGLFIASISRDYFGKLSRVDIENLYSFTKKCLKDPVEILKIRENSDILTSFQKSFSPLLYMGFAISSLYINETNKASQQKMRLTIDNIEKNTNAIKLSLDNSTYSI